MQIFPIENRSVWAYKWGFAHENNAAPARKVDFRNYPYVLTAARTMQTVENFDNYYRHAKDARFYIRESRKGQ